MYDHFDFCRVCGVNLRKMLKRSDALTCSPKCRQHFCRCLRIGKDPKAVKCDSSDSVVSIRIRPGSRTPEIY